MLVNTSKYDYFKAWKKIIKAWCKIKKKVVMSILMLQSASFKCESHESNLSLLFYIGLLLIFEVHIQYSKAHLLFKREWMGKETVLFIHFHCIEKKSSNILLDLSFCVPHKKAHMGFNDNRISIFGWTTSLCSFIYVPCIHQNKTFEWPNDLHVNLHADDNWKQTLWLLERGVSIKSAEG